MPTAADYVDIQASGWFFVLTIANNLDKHPSQWIVVWVHNSNNLDKYPRQWMVLVPTIANNLDIYPGQ